jgi:hypothetical protein
MRRWSATRWPGGVRAAAVAVAALLLGAGGFLAWRAEGRLWRVIAAFDRTELGGTTRELRFLKAAYDRIAGQLQDHAGNPAAASLRREREAVLERMREVAEETPAASLPPDIRRLLAAPTPALAVGGGAPRQPARAPAIEVGALHVGLSTSSPLAGFAGLTIDPDLTLPLFVEVLHNPARQPRHHRRPPARASAERAADRPK